jgi:hypothetical protein
MQFVPHALHYVIVAIFCKCARSRGAEIEIQPEQVRWVFGGPQASSCEDPNIVVIKTSPSASNQYPCLLF